MPTVPTSQLSPETPAGPQPSQVDLMMAAAIMKEQGKLDAQPVAYQDSLLRYGRPNLSADRPSKDRIEKQIRPFVLPEDQMNESGGEYVRQNLTKPKGI